MAMYDETEKTAETRRLERLAHGYNPDTSAEYDRIRQEVPAEKISPTLRLAMGYADSARNAATQLNNEK